MTTAQSHLPRNGRYEIFSNAGRTYCFDDPGFEWINTPKGMIEWIKVQDTSLWHGMGEPLNDVAFYLKPELYILWKLRWAR
jgi:hypothetical protein